MGSERNGSCLTAVRNTSCCTGACLGFRVSDFGFQASGLGFRFWVCQRAGLAVASAAPTNKHVGSRDGARGYCTGGGGAGNRGGRAQRQGAGTGRARTSLISPTHKPSCHLAFLVRLVSLTNLIFLKKSTNISVIPEYRQYRALVMLRSRIPIKIENQKS